MPWKDRSSFKNVMRGLNYLEDLVCYYTSMAKYTK